MNFDDAITAHSQWRIRLQSVIAGTSQEKLDPQVVGRDDKCPLGQWIHGEANQKFAGLKEFPILVQKHAAFHLSAAGVLRMVAAGKLAEAKENVTRGEFFDASIQTINAIRHLRKQVEAKP